MPPNTVPTSTAEHLARLKAQSKQFMERMHELFLGERFLLGSQSETRLRRSLVAVDRRDLLDRTLLTPTVHAKHADKIATRFLRRWKNIRQKRLDDWKKIPHQLRHGTAQPSDNEIAANHFRFCTLIDSVTVVSADAAIHAAVRMKGELIAAVKASSGIWCLGAIEAEVISLPIMRSIRDKNNNSPSEKRKLDVCDELASELDNTVYRGETHLMLVHFHGIVTAKNESQFDSFRLALQANAQWSKALRQIEIKKLSEQFNDKPKSVEQNLQHIARYITKGGNDWTGNAIAFRYKIGFDKNKDVYDEVADTQINWRRCEILRAEHKLDGIDDAMSMTVQEIAELAIFIDKLMGSNSTRTGYLVNAGS